MGQLRRPTSDDIFVIQSGIFASAIIVVLVLTGYVLISGSVPVWSKFGTGFLTGTTWSPVKEVFGALPYILGTIVTSLIAIVIGVPLSI